MRGRRVEEDHSVTEEALDAMNAGELRALIRDLLPWFDATTRTRFLNRLVEGAARGTSGWKPAGPTSAGVQEIVQFAEQAQQAGEADPAAVDTYLHQGSNAFLRQDYAAACEIFRALLVPISAADIYLGQHEVIDEVLSVDPTLCAGQYVVAVYMTAAVSKRAELVLAAIDDVQGIRHFFTPLRDLEQVALGPLPDLDAFLPTWRALLETRAAAAGQSDWDRDEDRWLRDVVSRTEGPVGLAQRARASKRTQDLRAWCDALVERGDWTAALAAYDEATELTSSNAYARGEFLDGAVMAAKKLGSVDLTQRLERAWREAPTLERLVRWLGVATSTEGLHARGAEALAAVPQEAGSQRALLHVLSGDLSAAAKLLAAAPGLGWSRGEHPGHLLCAVFARMCAGIELSIDLEAGSDVAGSLIGHDLPVGSDVASLVELAGVSAPTTEARQAIIEAMRTAAEKRLAGVTENKRRRHYGHAASLVALCSRMDEETDSTGWIASVRARYRRYPALQEELDGHLRGDERI